VNNALGGFVLSQAGNMKTNSVAKVSSAELRLKASTAASIGV
jgi:hypothetical protein